MKSPIHVAPARVDRLIIAKVTVAKPRVDPTKAFEMPQYDAMKPAMIRPMKLPALSITF